MRALRAPFNFPAGGSVDKCFVPSDALHDAARRRGLAESQIVQHGLPIRRGFWYGSEEEAPASIRRRLGLEADLPTVLVVGGGDGMGGIVDIARALGSRLGRQPPPASAADSASSQMVVVCGKNDGARRALERDASWGSGVRVHVKGFVDNMDEWMKASDALVTKAGPGTIAEASICGLPCMMFSYLYVASRYSTVVHAALWSLSPAASFFYAARFGGSPGQEEGNIPYVEDAGFGAYSGDPAEIAGTVAAWLSSPERLRSMRRSALAAARPRATLDIAGDLAEIACAAKGRGGRSPVGPAGRKAAAVASSA
jgi:1,2-diacylglycerol 3-beta-galactosyltransferase